MNASQKVVDLRDVEVRMRTRHLKKIRFPDEYLVPGQRVHLIVEPMTLPRKYVYRPYDHFVLETEVTSVCFTPDGKVHYTFATPFDVYEFFRSRNEAIEKFRSIYALGAQEVVHFVTHVEEKRELEKLVDDDIPF